MPPFFPPCWVHPDWPDITKGAQMKMYSLTREAGLKDLRAFIKWLQQYQSIPGTTAKQMATRAYVALVYSGKDVVPWIEQMPDRTDRHKMKVCDAVRHLCKWRLTMERVAPVDRAWAATVLPAVDKMHKKYNTWKSDDRYAPTLEPLDASEILLVEHAIERSYSPQHPWAVHLLKPFFNLPITVTAFISIKRQSVEKMIEQVDNGDVPLIGVPKRGRGKGAGRKRMYPAYWAIREFRELVENRTIPWEYLGDVIVPRRHGQKFVTHRSSRLLQLQFREVVMPLLSELRGEAAVSGGGTVFLLERTVQARVLRELGDWATAAQIGDCSIEYLRRIPWAQEACNGPDPRSVWANHRDKRQRT